MSYNPYAHCNPHAHSERLKFIDFSKAARGCLAKPGGFFTAVRWSIFADGGRYHLTGRLMNRARCLDPHVSSPRVTGCGGSTQ